MEQFIYNFLKKLKLNEPLISTMLGGFVIIIVSVLIFNYFKAGKVEEIAIQQPQEELGQLEEVSEGEFMPINLPAIHKVEAGEDLWSISKKYYTSGYNWQDIANENNIINPNHIEVGQELKLPKTIVKNPTVKKQEKLSEDQPSKQLITDSVYKVKKGDYLWKIAVFAYDDGYKWPEIAKANNLTNPDYLEEGLELKLTR